MKQFPKVQEFIESTKQEVIDQGYVETIWGRREYFYTVEGDEGDVLARQQRQAVNFLYN
jgi:DNA polymerase-1